MLICMYFTHICRNAGGACAFSQQFDGAIMKANPFKPLMHRCIKATIAMHHALLFAHIICNIHGACALLRALCGIYL